jgi:hypothetical protein
MQKSTVNGGDVTLADVALADVALGLTWHCRGLASEWHAWRVAARGRVNQRIEYLTGASVVWWRCSRWPWAARRLGYRSGRQREWSEESSGRACGSVEALIWLFSTALTRLSPKVSIGIWTSSKQGLGVGKPRKTERWGMAEAMAAPEKFWEEAEKK